ncbi:CPCC family cysteine-rich protein [Acidaminococcus timonensis]|uniref:CPCC family cysteine-rich protein n=1 Tax=Acidaminococcus timonensis TaxID=1871002 RepID=UPI003C6CE8C6
MAVKCPVCGKSKLSSFEICPFCGWSNDYVQLEYPDMENGDNAKSSPYLCVKFL